MQYSHFKQIIFIFILHYSPILSYDLHGVLFSQSFVRLKLEKLTEKKKVYPPGPHYSFDFLPFIIWYKKNSYLGMGVLKYIERGFSQHRRTSASQVNTKTTIIMERINIDDHNNLVEILIGLH